MRIMIKFISLLFPLKLTETIKNKLAQGVRVKGVDYAPIEASVRKSHRRNLDPDVTHANQWLNVSLQEGKNREIRKVFQHFNLTVRDRKSTRLNSSHT